ncbi:hypothetical protein ABBQ38_007350 [Trebouxia sp. C0009 RCD-2024]
MSSACGTPLEVQATDSFAAPKCCTFNTATFPTNQALTKKLTLFAKFDYPLIQNLFRSALRVILYKLRRWEWLSVAITPIQLDQRDVENSVHLLNAC